MLNEIDLSRTDLNLLVLFDVVLRTRHVGRASERLNLTPSAVSHGLGRLRRLLGDPLFLRTPKGVAPTARAMELAAPIAEVLARARSVIATAEPFDPAQSARRFAIGAPDGASAAFLPPFLAALRRAAPGIVIGLRQLLPAPGEISPERAWRNVFAELDERALDIAVLPATPVPARFHVRSLYQEDFVIAMRAGHPFADNPGLKRYGTMRHLVVSQTGDPQGFVDEILARRHIARRTVLTVPSFMLALSIIAETDLISAMPRRFVDRYGARFGVVGIEPPLRLTTFRLDAVASRAAMMDAGLKWLFDLLATSEQTPSHPQRASLTAPSGSERRARRGSSWR